MAIAGCGSAPPPPPPPPAPVVAPTEPKEASSNVEAEIGGLNEEAMVRAFNGLGPQIQACVEEGSAKVKPLGGHVNFALRIMKDGAVRWVYLKESTLGDGATEKCLLDAIRAKQWPKPVGGEGLAERTFDMDPRAAPIEIDEEREKRPIAVIRRDAWKCTKGARGTFWATVYIRTNGRVLTAGVSPPSAKLQEAADCLAEMIRKIPFVPAGAKTGKLTFRVP